MVRISIASSSTSTLSAEKQGKPKALVARVALKQGYTGKLERNNDRTGGKIVVDLSGFGVQPRGSEEQQNKLLASCQFGWLKVCEHTQEGKSCIIHSNPEMTD
uniref:Uncharacterized protein n=1 Tax=Anser brachyrhynchus TaxID=132585 RepID=A0A8B9I922_9AVES